MYFIDTHSHIYLKHFKNDVKEVVNRAAKQGVKYIFLPNIDSSSIDDMFNVSKQFPKICFPMIGLHPTSVEEDFEFELKVVEKVLSEHKFIAIGEIGIDLYWDKTFIEEQKFALKTQLELALLNNLPVVIHSRDSFNEVYEILESYGKGKLSGIFHAFSGSVEQAEKIIDLGFKIGIGGVVTYKNSGLADTVREIDLSNIVLETDSPYLTPVPKRGKRNEPTYLIYIAKKLSEIYNMKVEEIAQITSNNVRDIFNFN
ncbi:MAG: TatD family hydrolase [Bacteroidetes bacterium]|jgi:TatD DNase family protein|nr:TatD family hydrolase [Bacteroidota bacterium]MBT6686224.1 TatD family hydrolase [Bacteroidota bacterium]MBT7144297.1 TatD family hydrolase [Bacteroidota bacterium]MBT7493516.1 TatD family hydrolase [Bacteroidota bacterium]